MEQYANEDCVLFAYVHLNIRNLIIQNNTLKTNTHETKI